MEKRFHRLRIWLIIGSVGVGVMLAALTGGFIWRDHQLSTHEIDTRLENSAQAFAEYAEATLRAVNVALESTHRIVEQRGGLRALTDQDLLQIFNQQLSIFTSESAGVPAHAMFAVDHKGWLRVTTVEFSGKPVDASDREYFRHHRDHNDAEVLLSPLVISKTSGLQVVYLTKRINDGNGNFAGVLAISVRVKHFDDYYQRLGLTDGQTLNLFRKDGKPLYRFPTTEGFEKTDIASSPNLPRFIQPGGGHLVSISPIDGKLRRLGHYSGRQYPLLAIVSLTQNAAMTDWIKRAKIVGWISFGAAVGLALLFIFSLRQIKETERASRERTVAVDALASVRNQLIQTEKIAGLGQMVAVFSHDIGNPIGNGLLTVSTLSDHTREFKQELAAGRLKRSSLDAYLDSNETAADILKSNLTRARDLLDTFKQTALDQAVPNRRTITVSTWLQQMELSLSPPFRNSPVKLLVEAAPDLHLETQPGALGQVIANLVSNSRVHGFDEGQEGTVTIRARAGTNDRVTISVSDNGKGIPPEVMTRMFEPYFTTRAGQGGTGLGLHIVKTMVEETLGGQLNVNSAPGQGARFEIDLPPVVPSTNIPVAAG